MSTPTQRATSTPLSRFDVGDRVVHPRHGAGEVVGRQRRPIQGSVRDYLEIELAHASLRILVPSEGIAAVGLRPVVGYRRLRAILEVLEGTRDGMEANWSARHKHYLARLKGGDLLELAAVIRDLAVRAEASPLSTTERELYERSRRVLASELRYVLGVDTDRAGAYIDEHVDVRVIPEAPIRAESARSVAGAAQAEQR